MTISGNDHSPPSIQAGEFEGPLDLLLDEVRRQRVSIEEIAMAPIVARYLEYVRVATERNLDLDIEWLHLAATLIHWKSRSLLPPDAIGEPVADPIRDHLVQALMEHRKQAAGELSRRRSLEETRFSRTQGEVLAAPDQPEPAASMTVWDLIQQARDISRWAREHRSSRRRWRETWDIRKDDVTVAEMIDYLRARFAGEEGKLDGASLIQEQPTALHKSCLFLGMLEMVRDQQLKIEQTQSFGPLWLYVCDS